VSTPSTQSPTPAASDRKSRAGGLAAAAVLVACAAACSLPLIIGAGALSGIGAFLAGGQFIGIILIAVALAATGWWIIRRTSRRRAAAISEEHSSDGTSCDCKDC